MIKVGIDCHIVKQILGVYKWSTEQEKLQGNDESMDKASGWGSPANTEMFKYE